MEEVEQKPVVVKPIKNDKFLIINCKWFSKKITISFKIKAQYNHELLYTMDITRWIQSNNKIHNTILISKWVYIMEFAIWRILLMNLCVQWNKDTTHTMNITRKTHSNKKFHNTILILNWVCMMEFAIWRVLLMNLCAMKQGYKSYELLILVLR